jgi:RNA polymerase sigma-70 factor (ECF subfamily)
MESLNEQFGKIYDEYIEKIYRFVYLKVGSHDIAEDITSKVFTKGWESFQKQGSNIKNQGSFLYQVARNAVIDHYRQKGRTNVVSSEVSTPIIDLKANAHEAALLGSDINLVKNALFGLKKEYQDIIIWHYLEDMPISEVAKLSGKSEGTVRVMLHRGLKELRGKIQQV